MKLHRQHGTELIYTFSSYNDGRPLLVHLEEELKAHGFNLEPRSSKEVFDKIVSTEENKYILKLVKLVCTFIQNFKTNGFNTEKFYEWESKSTNEPEICDFMTNDLRGGDIPILKCDKCDGYLIVKEGNAGPFLGCTNYKEDKTGCDRTMTRWYLKQMLEHNKLL